MPQTHPSPPSATSADGRSRVQAPVNQGAVHTRRAVDLCDLLSERVDNAQCAQERVRFANLHEAAVRGQAKTLDVPDLHTLRHRADTLLTRALGERQHAFLLTPAHPYVIPIFFDTLRGIWQARVPAADGASMETRAVQAVIRSQQDRYDEQSRGRDGSQIAVERLQLAVIDTIKSRKRHLPVSPAMPAAEYDVGMVGCDDGSRIAAPATATSLLAAHRRHHAEYKKVLQDANAAKANDGRPMISDSVRYNNASAAYRFLRWAAVNGQTVVDVDPNLVARLVTQYLEDRFGGIASPQAGPEKSRLNHYLHWFRYRQLRPQRNRVVATSDGQREAMQSNIAHLHAYMTSSCARYLGSAAKYIHWASSQEIVVASLHGQELIASVQRFIGSQDTRRRKRWATQLQAYLDWRTRLFEGKKRHL